MEWVDLIALDFLNNNNDAGTTQSIRVSGGQHPTETLTVTCVATTNAAVMPCTRVAIGAVSAGGVVDITPTSGTTAGIAQVTLQLTSSLNGDVLSPISHSFTVRVFRTSMLRLSHTCRLA